MRIKLPEPKYDSNVSLEKSLKERRSVREYSEKPLKLEEVSQLLWAVQGITARWGGRTAPSAGALFPLEVYIAVGNVIDLSGGIYRYDSKERELIMIAKEDIRFKLADAAFGQNAVRIGRVDLVITAVYERTTQKYGNRGVRYVHMEAGHAAQNVCLQATALGLGAVTIGAFYEDKVSAILNLPKDETPLYIIPIGELR